MMIQAVLFDMDGVLFDTERMSSRILDQVGAELGYGNLSAAKSSTIGTRGDNMRRVYARFFGQDFPFDKFLSIYRARQDEEVQAHGVPVKPGVYRLLDYLKKEGYRLAVATSTVRERVLRYLAETRIDGYFDSVVCGDMVEKGKPDPEIYLTAARNVGIAPEDCIVVEDSPSGCESGFRAGAKVVMVPDLIQPDERIRPMLFACVGTLGDMIPLLDRMRRTENN